jgi:hypothetical protein
MPLVTPLDVYYPRICEFGHTFYTKESTPSDRDFAKIQEEAEAIIYGYEEFEAELKEYTDEKRKQEAIRKRNLPSNIKKRKKEAQRREKQYRKEHGYKYKDMGYKIVKRPEDKTSYRIVVQRRLPSKWAKKNSKKITVKKYIPVDDRGQCMLGHNRNL